MKKVYVENTKLLESFRKSSMYIARFVRDELEDLHVESAVMNNDTMEKINRAVRKWVYNYFRVMILDETAQNQWLYRKQPPTYWEQDEFDEIDKIMKKNAIKINRKKKELFT